MWQHLWSSGQEGLMGVVIRMEGHCTTHTILIRVAGHCINTQLSKPLVLHYKRLNHTPEIRHSSVQRCTLSCIYFEHNTTLIQFISCTPESKSDDDWCRVCEPENCHLPSSPKILKYEMWSAVFPRSHGNVDNVSFMYIFERRDECIRSEWGILGGCKSVGCRMYQQQQQQQAHGRPQAVPRAQQGGEHPRQPRTFHSTHIDCQGWTGATLFVGQQLLMCICKIIFRFSKQYCTMPLEDMLGFF